MRFKLKWGTYEIEDGLLYHISETPPDKKGKAKEKRMKFLRCGDDIKKAARYLAQSEMMPYWKVIKAMRRQGNGEA